MKSKLFTAFCAILMTAGGVLAQTSWLDRPVTNWNPTNGIVPNAPRATGDAPTIVRCRDGIRNPESLADRALTRAGWTLFGASQSYGTVTLINGMASVDGMCRPNQYNTFVFVSNRFAGTLSPTVMNSRTDGALSEARLNSATNIAAEFTRYSSSDALCCPSQTSSVFYTITGGRITANTVETQANCQQDQNPDNPAEQPVEPGVVRGTVTYRQRGNFQRNSTLTVRLVDITSANAPAITVGEQRIEITNQQSPIPFEIRVNPNRINQNRRYAVQAEMSSNGRTTLATDKTYNVLTQGNPGTIDINLVPIGSIGNDQGNNSKVIRGTVSYRERIALPNNSSVTVQLVDGLDSSANVLSETNFNTNNRQVPIPFELRYNPNQIDTRRRYYIRAEIDTDGRLAFATNENIAVLTQGSPTDNLQLILNTARETATVITGQTLNISKFGTGSMQIEGRNNAFLVRANVNVKTDGSADVTVAGVTGATMFSGKLTYFDQNTLRIAIESSGNADAGGEIEVKYNGRSLTSITSNNLTLDGQNVTLRF